MRCSRSRFLCAVAAAAVAALVAVLWTGRAAAFCQEGTVPAPAGYDPTTQGCINVGMGATGGLPMFWPNQCVGYSLQRNASQQIALMDAKRVASNAFAAWTSAQCPSGDPPSISVFQYPDVDCDSTPSQLHNNVIMFRDAAWPHDDSSNAIGYTTITADLDTGEMLGADIEINTFGNMIVPDAPAPLGEYDLGSILTHEAGHFLGLAHSADSTAVMYAFYKPGSTTLQPDDISGICSIYDPSGTRDPSTSPVPSASCNADPPEGFLTECGSADAGVVEDAEAGAADATNPPAPCPDSSTCSISPAPGSAPGRGGLGIVALLGAFAFIRRTRRRPPVSRPSEAGARRRGTRIAATGAGVSLALLGASIAAPGDARASVASAALFEELVDGATAAAVVVPVEQTSVWEGNRVVTYTRVQVDRLVAGQNPARGLGCDAWGRRRAHHPEGRGGADLRARPAFASLRATTRRSGYRRAGRHVRRGRARAGTISDRVERRTGGPAEPRFGYGRAPAPCTGSLGPCVSPASPRKHGPLRARCPRRSAPRRGGARDRGGLAAAALT